MEIIFTGCQDLDFTTNYRPACKLQAIGQGSETKLFWMRRAQPEGCPAMVQFCKKRGRLNHPESCLKSGNSCCSDYIEIQHKINVDESELES